MPFAKKNRLAKGGKRPNAGRRPSEVRAACAMALAERVYILGEIADNKKQRPADRIAAIRELARIALPSQLEHSGLEPLQFHPITLDGDKEAKGDGNGKPVAYN